MNFILNHGGSNGTSGWIQTVSENGTGSGITFHVLSRELDKLWDDLISAEAFWLSAHNCQVPTPTSQNLELALEIRIFGAD
jgi:hypothetical protein